MIPCFGVIIHYKGKSISFKARNLSFFGKIIGLMFKKSSEILLFDFRAKRKWAIHSWFVFFDFAAVWLDDQNNVVEWRIVKPFETYIVPSVSFHKLVEIPLSKDNKSIISFLVGKGKGLNISATKNNYNC